MQTFRNILESYGSDYDETLERFLGKEDFYLKMLGMVFQDPNLQKLEDELKNNDLGKAFEAAHTLKGIAGNLGLTPYYEAVSQIVEPLRRREEMDYEKLYSRVHEEFERARELYGDLQTAEAVK